MNANELLRIIDTIHRDKNIDKEVIFQAIEAALGDRRQEAIRRRTRDRRHDRPQGRLDLAARTTAFRSMPRKRPAASAPRPPSKSSSRRCAKPSATPCSTNTTRKKGSSSPASCSATKAAPPPSRCRTAKPSCPAASRFPAKPTTPTSACGPRCSKFAKAAAA